ncbi:hypothetical protein BLTE_20890 [Blastochloris tepida]|uniref:Uncharacterized protein n=1 Tax=Blastochloris tepida TaxID=2233851 RepID=A0A348G1H1_9HYPH|nr:hypothetical protein BLTE_20890 [Blastochloris tepida]
MPKAKLLNQIRVGFSGVYANQTGAYIATGSLGAEQIAKDTSPGRPFHGKFLKPGSLGFVFCAMSAKV